MEKEERLTKQIKTVYTEIAKRLVDPSFSFPEGGQAKRQLSQFIVNFTQICGGEFNTSRLVDYCVFQLHKNRNAQYQRTLAPKTFGTTALQKYLSTLMWSPFSPACQICTNVEKCKQETAIKYPELYRIRLEEYGERR